MLGVTGSLQGLKFPSIGADDDDLKKKALQVKQTFETTLAKKHFECELGAFLL